MRVGQDMLIWKLQKDITRARLALAQIYEIIDEIYNWDEEYALFDLERMDVEEVGKILKEFFGEEKEIEK